MLPWFEDNKFPLYLAPMSRHTDAVYRQLCKERGADVLVTEFVRADSIVHGVPEVWEGTDFGEAERPMGVQIYGSIPENMAKAARMIYDKKKPDFIDINFGCPADKVTCANAGSSMLRDLPLMKRVVTEMIRELPEIPITAKIRIGWDSKSIVALDAGKLLEDAGVQTLAIHGRTKEQGYRGDADWDVIAEVSNALTIPVIGNGNICNGEDVRKARDVYGVSGAMIGRAALGYPWIFRDVKHYLETGEEMLPPTLRERWDLIIRYTEIIMKRPFRVERHDDIQWMRPKFMKLSREMPGSKALRGELGKVVTKEELLEISERHIEKFGEDKRGHETWSPKQKIA